MARHETGTCVVEVLRSGDAAVLDAHGGAFVPAGERAAVAGWLLDEGDDALIERLAAAAWDANRVNGVRFHAALPQQRATYLRSVRAVVRALREGGA